MASEDKKSENNMLPEYDFQSGQRGKHARAYTQGHTVTIHQSDGTTLVQQYVMPEGAVMLEPDVQEYFPDTESVNTALRSLIALIPKKRKAG